MRKVFLHGSLGKKYGKSFEFEAQTAGEIVRALCANFPGFQKEIIDGSWHVVLGKKVKGGFDLSEEHISGFNLGKGDLHISPAVAGSKNGSGALKIIVGIALVGLSFGFAGALGGAIAPAFGATTWGNAIGYIGFSLAIAGMSTLLAPETPDDKSEKDARSFVSSGPGNTNSEGAIVPIVYGEVMTGSVLISGGIDIEQIGT